MTKNDVRQRIEELLAANGTSAGPNGDLFAAFTRVLFGEAGARVFRTHTSEGLLAASRTAFELCQRRAPGEQLLRLSSPAELPGRSVIEILQDDRPFLVDTVRLFLRRHQLQEQRLLHPTLEVVRDASGNLETIASPSENGDSDAKRESLIYVEVFPKLDDARAEELSADLREVMRWVANVTSDHTRMIRAVREIEAGVEAAGRDFGVAANRAAKICRFLDWLVEDHFVLMGVRHYAVKSAGDGMSVSIEPGTGLGMWRDDQTSRFLEMQSGSELPEGLLQSLDDPRIIQISKGWIESRIHRAGRLDRIFIKEHDDAGELCGFHIVSGLFTYNALRTPSSQLPLLAERLEQILEADNAAVGSHRHKALVAAFDSAPMEFLFGADLEHNATLIHEIVEAEGSEEPRVVLQTDPGGKSFYAAVILPRERYSEDLRRGIRRLFEVSHSVGYIDDRVSFLEEGTALIHFFCTLKSGAAPETERLEAEIARIASRWDDDLTDELIRFYGPSEGGELAARYSEAFPAGLHLATHPADAVRDVTGLEALHRTGEPQISLFFERTPTRATTSVLRLYLHEDRLLSDLLPIIDHFAIRVSDARLTRIAALDRPPANLHALHTLPLGADQADLDGISERLGDALRGVLGGSVPSDMLNALVLGAGLDWRQVDLLRGYIEYFSQIQIGLTHRFMCEVLLGNPIAARILIRFHEARLAPDLEPEERNDLERELRPEFAQYRDRVENLNEDRALGAMFELVQATLRTNFFAKLDGAHRIAFKLDPSTLTELRPPYPYREIFVHGPGIDGIHLRGGPVARGGLRWSDRQDDFRTEVLGLMRTQQLKNGLIVPVGAKGGFVVRTLGLTPQEARSEADAKYEIFIAALLDITDNIGADGAIIPPAGVTRREGDDPYLVVAADKGTAHLSDTANAIAKRRGFWLGDAFASGGSVGYDHKKYAITARGAWECVRHHFAELGVDPEEDVYRVVGIGDMSGDVFGNGLLLMRNAKLVAAFDHRNIFIDPDPDPHVSWAERKRLFDLPRSSWSDYDTELISRGGGVFSRTAKRIDISPEARAALGFEVPSATGPELVRAILCAPVDLLWNGGIGTYVKASHETQLAAGDRSNESVRIDAYSLRARIIGEGGNLGLTQAARVEAALAGVRLDTDAIHNSAGVDLSDHEVNFKILLAPLVQSGALSEEKRWSHLLEVADDACESVLSHNRSQSLAISLDEVRSQQDLEPFRWAIDMLCAAQNVTRSEVGLPDEATFDARGANGTGLTRPELAALLGLAKLHFRLALATDDFVDSERLEPLYRAYFPPNLRDAFPEALQGHRLRREVTALAVASRIIDAGGASTVSTLVARRGIGIPTAAAAWLSADEILGGDGQRAALLALRGSVPLDAIYQALLVIDEAVSDIARYLIAEDLTAPPQERLKLWREGLFNLSENVDGFLSSAERDLFAERRAQHVAAGFPAGIAALLAGGPLADRGLNIVRLVEDTKRAPLELATAYAQLGELSGINRIYQSLPFAQAGDAWDRVVLMDLRTELLSLQRDLTESAVGQHTGDPATAVDAFLRDRETVLQRVRTLEPEARSAPSASALAVVTQALMRLRN